MRTKFAIVGFVALLATLLTAVPAGADDFTARVLSNGTLLVRGDNSDNGVAACQTGPTTWLVGHFDDFLGELSDVEEFDGVTTDVKFDMRGGDDVVFIDCDLFGMPSAESAPRDIIIFGGSGDDNVTINGVNVDDDINVQLGSGNIDTLSARALGVADDFLVRGQGGSDGIAIRSSIVGDRADINTGPGASHVGVGFSEFGRTQIIGGSSGDVIGVFETDMGEKPRVVTGNGDDTIDLDGVSATTRLLVNSGSGDDRLFLEPVAPAFMLNINLVAGNDTLNIDGDLNAGDLLNGGAGADCLTHFNGADFGATIKKFELCN